MFSRSANQERHVTGKGQLTEKSLIKTQRSFEITAPIDPLSVDGLEEGSNSVVSEGASATVNSALTDLQEEVQSARRTEAEVVETPKKTATQENKRAQASRNTKKESFFTLAEEDQARLRVNVPTQQPGTGLIGGITRQRFASQLETAVVAQGAADSDPTSNIEDDEVTELPRADGQARGYLMLYLMHPRARQTVEAQLEALRVANIEHLYLGVLIDGTFGENFPYLLDVVRRINQNDARVTLSLYLSNGSTMRRFDTTEIDTDFSQIDPIEFRDLIQFDSEVRLQYLQIAQRALPIFQLNRDLNPANVNIAVPMLEDNLTFESYLAMRALAQAVLGSDVQYVRNPCPGCFEGNDIEAGGDGLELHNPFMINLLGPGDGFSNDGTTYHFDNEVPVGDSLSIADLTNFIIATFDRNADYFALWRRERQGLVAQVPSTPPDLRTYEVPTVDQLAEEVRLLRAGLNES